MAVISFGVTKTVYAVKGAMDVPARHSAPGALRSLRFPGLESDVTEAVPYRRGRSQPRYSEKHLVAGMSTIKCELCVGRVSSDSEAGTQDFAPTCLSVTTDRLIVAS
jgi:hypothetical protein